MCPHTRTDIRSRGVRNKNINQAMSVCVCVCVSQNSVPILVLKAECVAALPVRRSEHAIVINPIRCDVRRPLISLLFAL